MTDQARTKGRAEAFIAHQTRDLLPAEEFSVPWKVGIIIAYPNACNECDG
jgi:hypothetical protein